jgi:LysM repeat protein
MYYAILKKRAIKSVISILGVLIFGLFGCQQSTSTREPTSTPGTELTPYRTATPSLTPDPSIQVTVVSPTKIPAPTPTPYIYTVVENDTLTGIAFRHSVTLEDLIAANPGIDPNFLTIGLTLTVPLEGVVVAALPTPTPIPMGIRAPQCYPSPDNSLVCMAVVENDQSIAVENVVVLFSLDSGDRGDPVTKTAIMPLNILPAGRQSAVSATFYLPISQDYVPEATLTSVIPVLDGDQRYLKSELQVGEIVITPDGKQARVRGAIMLLPEQSIASIVWVSALAYDAQKNIVGIRKWVAHDILEAGNQINFELVVYSLGLPIDHVDIITETRP